MLNKNVKASWFWEALLRRDKIKSHYKHKLYPV